MASAAQIDPGEIVSEWVTEAMASANVNPAELSRRSGVPVMTIHNIIHQKQKRGCRVDILIVLIASCGLTFRVVKPQ